MTRKQFIQWWETSVTAQKFKDNQEEILWETWQELRKCVLLEAAEKFSHTSHTHEILRRMAKEESDTPIYDR